MNILNTSDRRGRFDIPGIFKQTPSSKLDDEIDFQGPAEVKDIPFRRSPNTSSSKRTTSFDQSSLAQSTQENARLVQVVSPKREPNTISVPTRIRYLKAFAPFYFLLKPNLSQ